MLSRPKKKTTKKKDETKTAPAKAKGKPRIAKTEASDEAEEAVKHFEELRERLTQEERLFEEEHPDAVEALNKIDEIKLQANTALASAKGKVSEAKTTIGEFRYVASFSSPGYEGNKLMELVCSLKKGKKPDFEAIGALAFELYQRGVIRGANVDKKAAKIFHDRGGELAEAVEKSWDPGGSELTGRVYTPKI